MAEGVYWAVYLYRQKTNAKMLEGQAIASSMINKAVAIAAAKAAEVRTLPGEPAPPPRVSMRVIGKYIDPALGEIDMLAPVDPVRVGPKPPRIIDLQPGSYDFQSSGGSPSPPPHRRFCNCRRVHRRRCNLPRPPASWLPDRAS